MANEITTTLLGSNGGLTASILSEMVMEQLYDPTDLSALVPFIGFGQGGSTTLDVTQDAVPGAFTATTSETDGSNIVNSAYTTAEFSHTPSNYSRQYTLTDLVAASGGPIDRDRLAANLIKGVRLTNTDLTCNLFPSLSNSVGTSGVDLDIGVMLDAQFQLNLSNVSGRYAAVLHNQQFNDFQRDLKTAAGWAQFSAATEAMLSAKGPGFKGTWLGIDIYQSDSVTAVDSGANRSGAMFGAGAFSRTVRDPRPIVKQNLNPGDVIFANEVMVLMIVRDNTNFATAVRAFYYPSFVEAEDARGVEIKTDA